MKLQLTLLIFTFSIATTFAQLFEINEAPRVIENGTYNSFLLELPDMDQSFVEKEWKTYMKKKFRSRTKNDRKADLLVSRKARISELSNDKMTVQSRILEEKKPNQRISVIVWYQVAEQQYINSKMDSIKGQKARQILSDFAIIASRSHAENILNTQEESLSDLEKELKNLEKENQDYNKEIEKAKSLISENEKNIERNKTDQNNKMKEIEEQKSKVENAKETVQQFRGGGNNS